MIKKFIDNTIKSPHHRQVLKVCLPLVLSLSATTVMEFTDRVFLSNYSIDAISAALPAGITSYLFLAFFGGVGGYAGVFIAQYTGRGDLTRIGTVLWQGIFFTVFSGLLLYILGVFGTHFIFSLAGHPPEVRVLEEIYFSILCKGAILHIAMTTLSTFFTGRGLTRPVMIITFIGVLVNIPLDYGLIFGKWGLPELGVKGAAIATVTAWGINVLFLVFLIFTKKNNHLFGVFAACKYNHDIFVRLMRFGIPGSLQFTVDILAFTLFILFVGRIGKPELAATNIVLSINALAFMPSMGASQGMSVLVGQALGHGSPKLASAYVRSGCQLIIFYIFFVDLLFIFAPDLMLAPFLQEHSTDPTFTEIGSIGKLLLRIIAAYLFFDALYMVLSGALRGAGDTKYMMFAISGSSLVFLIIPVYLGITYFQISVITAWIWILVFITALFLLAALRFKSGKWKKMLVIEVGEQSKTLRHSIKKQKEQESSVKS